MYEDYTSNPSLTNGVTLSSDDAALLSRLLSHALDLGTNQEPESGGPTLIGRDEASEARMLLSELSAIGYAGGGAVPDPRQATLLGGDDASLFDGMKVA